MKRIYLSLFIPSLAFSAIAQETGYVDLNCIKDFATQGVWANKPYFNSDAIWQTSDGTLQVPDANSNLNVDINTNIETGLISGYSNTPITIHDLNYNLELNTRITYGSDGKPIYSTPQITLIGAANANLNITGNLDINLNKSDTYWNPSTFNITVGGRLHRGRRYKQRKGQHLSCLRRHERRKQGFRHRYVPSGARPANPQRICPPRAHPRGTPSQYRGIALSRSTATSHSRRRRDTPPRTT